MSAIASPRRIRNPETLALLGQQLRHAREAAGLAQSKVKHMRQGTISKVENGLDVTLDTFLSYATSLGLEIALVPIGKAAVFQSASGFDRSPSTASAAPLDLLDEFANLRDPE